MSSAEIGASAPPFSLVSISGPLTPDSLRGKPFVLYFYPKDDTTGCTQEAQEFSALSSDFAQLGTRVIGVSRDSLESHAKFAAKHALTVTLASDPDGAACQLFDVWVEKSMYGRRYMGIERSTFLFDGDATLRKLWRRVRVLGHAQDVLDAARTLCPEMGQTGTSAR